MQADSVIISEPDYAAAYMAAGRPAKIKRAPFGERLFAARQQAGLSQMQMAEKLGVTQPSYAAWERRAVALKPEHLSQLAGILNVPVGHLLGHENHPQRKGGPAGKLRRVFEQANQLPRHQQSKVVEFLENFLRGMNGKAA